MAHVCTSVGSWIFFPEFRSRSFDNSSENERFHPGRFVIYFLISYEILIQATTSEQNNVKFYEK